MVYTSWQPILEPMFLKAFNFDNIWACAKKGRFTHVPFLKAHFFQAKQLVESKVPHKSFFTLGLDCLDFFTLGSKVPSMA